MLKLNFERDNRGLYKIDTQKQNQYDLSINTQSLYQKENKFSLWLTKGNGRCLLKTSAAPEYIMSLFSELLFSKFAEANNIESAEIDGAWLDDSRFGIISKDVVSDGVEKFTLPDIALVVGLNGEIKNLSKIINIEYSTVDMVTMLLEEFGKLCGLKIDKNLRLNLLKMALVDYLTVQVDRHPSNYLFEIKNIDGESVIALCPLFDNEYVFNCDALTSEFEDDKRFFHEFMSDKVKKSEKLESFIQLLLINCISWSQPAFGIKASVNPDDYAENNYEIFSGIPVKKAMEAFKQDLVRELNENDDLMRFYKSIQFDGFKYAQKIKEETKIQIPNTFVDLANKQFLFRKMSLDLALSQTNNEEPGEE